MAKGRPVIVVGLDIGTSKTVVIIAEAGSGSPKLIGTAISPSVGLQKGRITDLDAVAKAIGQALEKAEKMAGVKATNAYVSYNGANISVRNCRINFTACNRAVSRGENGSVITPSELTSAGIPQGEKVLQLIPPRIIPDLFGYAPESDARAITARTRDITNIIQSARMAGLAVQDILYGPLAGAEALLSPAEREFGTILIDVGAGTTSISIFDRGLIRETAVLAVGGEHLAGDLAIGLRTSLARAEEILKKTSLQAQDGEEREEFVSTTWPEGEENKKVSGDLIVSIIDARITEILDLVAAVIKGFNYPGLLPGGAVFYGGVSWLSGLALLAESRLQIPVRIGSTENTGPAISPAYTNALGLVKYGSMRLCEEGQKFRERRTQSGGFMGKFLKWFQDKRKVDDYSLKG